MQSFRDLNNYSSLPVTYSSFNDYSIAFGSQTGSNTAQQINGVFFPIYKRRALTTFTEPYKDLLVNIDFSDETSISGIIYLGFVPGGGDTIRLIKNSNSSWTVIGIRSIADYNRFFDNTYIGVKIDQTTPFTVTVNVDDQIETSVSWSVAVTLVQNNVISSATSVTFAEDAQSTNPQLEIIENNPLNPAYTVSISVENPALGRIKTPSNTLVSVYTATELKSQMNTLLNQIRFVPAADSTANTNIVVSVTRQSDTIIRTVAANWNNTGHTEFSIPAAIAAAEDTAQAITGMSVTDMRPNNLSGLTLNGLNLANTAYTVTLQSVASEALLNYGNTTADTVSVSGTKTQLNSIFGNANTTPKLIPNSDFVGNTTITYTQTNTTDSVVQAAAVPIPVSVSDTPDATYVNLLYYPEIDTGIANMPFVIEITDLDTFALNYTVQLTLVSTDPAGSGSPGSFYLGNTQQSGNTISVTGSKSTINSTAFSFGIDPNYTGEYLLFALTVTKQLSGGGTRTIFNAVEVRAEAAVTNVKTSYNFTTNNNNTIFQNNALVFNAFINSGANITLGLASTGGFFNQNNTNTGASQNYTITQSAPTLTNLVPLMVFTPLSTQTTNATMRMTLVVNSKTWLDRTVTLVATPGVLPSGLFTTDTYNGSGPFSTNILKFLYANADVLLIGSGGAMGTALQGGRGGGGGGGVIELANQTIPVNSYTITVGGARTLTTGGNGNTSIVPNPFLQLPNAVAGGGAHGIGVGNGDGGAGGTPNGSAGGFGIVNTGGTWGGGGGGQSLTGTGVGKNAVSVNQGGIIFTTAGAGGDGYTSSLFPGTYAAGGGGTFAPNGEGSPPGFHTSQIGLGGRAAGYPADPPLNPQFDVTRNIGRAGTAIIRWRSRT